MDRELIIKMNGNNPKLKKTILQCYDEFEKSKDIEIDKPNYKEGDSVVLKKNMLLHGLRDIKKVDFISKNGFISPDLNVEMEKLQFAKYIKTVSFWKVLKDEDLSTYIKDYNDVVVKYYDEKKDKLVEKSFPFFDVNKEDLYNKKAWSIMTKKENNFLPSDQNNFSKLAFILNMKKGQNLIDMDLYSPKMDDFTAKLFVNSNYHRHFIEKKHSRNFNERREGHIVYGVPKNFIEGILVNRELEKEAKELDNLKNLFPDAYICNMDGKVIKA